MLQDLLSRGRKQSDKSRTYVGKYLDNGDKDELCKLLGIPTTTGGTDIFLELLRQFVENK